MKTLNCVVFSVMFVLLDLHLHNQVEKNMTFQNMWEHNVIDLIVFFIIIGGSLRQTATT